MKKLNLCGTWEMTGEDGRSFPSEVPGSVLNTLLEYGEIPDPFDGMNEFTACAETRRRWCFARSFRATAEELAHAHADLVFEGLDTLAAVEVNGQETARTDNMHCTWRFPVKELLKEGENHRKEGMMHSRKCSWPVEGDPCIFYFPAEYPKLCSAGLTITESPVHMNLQVTIFQTCEHVFHQHHT